MYATLYLVVSTDKIYALASLRLYFGMLILIPLMYYIKDSFMDFLLLSLIILAVLEKLLLVVHPEAIFYLPNYLRNAGITFGINQASGLLGGLHAFGGNRTVSGVLFLAIGLYFITHKSNRRKYAIYAFVVSVMCGSATALLLAAVILLSSLIRRLRSGTIIKILITFVILLICLFSLSFIFLQTSEQFGFFERFSYVYLEFIWHYKAMQIEEYLKVVDQASWLIGSITPAASSTIFEPGAFFGDFILLDLVARHGLLGCFLLILSCSYMFKGQYSLPIIVMLVGSFHYHVLFSMPGQMLFAYFFCKSQKEKNLR